MRLLALALVTVLATCVSAGADPSPSRSVAIPPAPSDSPTPTPTPTATPAPTRSVYWPLRGTLAPSAEATHRRPVVVRISNDVGARPQSGLSKADMVWELLAEGGITRYMAVFHSEEADSVGPIRSARLSDLHYAPMLRGILAHVGASPIVLARVRAAAARGEFIDADEFLYGSYYTRIAARSAPQNVYASTGRLREAAKAAGDTGNVDVPGLDFGVCGGPCPPRSAATSFTVPYLGAMRVTYSYDPSAGGFTRTQAGASTVDAATGRLLVATNVLVIFTDITPQPGVVEDSLGALSLDVRSTGTGKASIFVGGYRYEGRWSRQGNAMYEFRSDSGIVIFLSPGQTWVHVVPQDWVVESAR